MGSFRSLSTPRIIPEDKGIREAEHHPTEQFAAAWLPLAVAVSLIIYFTLVYNIFLFFSDIDTGVGQ